MKTKRMVLESMTLAALKDAARNHNKRSCVRIAQRKRALINDLKRKGVGARSTKGAGGAKKRNPKATSAKKKKRIQPEFMGAGAKKKKKRIQPLFMGAKSSGSSIDFGEPVPGGTSAQKKAYQKYLKQKNAYTQWEKYGRDANPELAF